MKVTLVASIAEQIRPTQRREARDIDWPNSLSLPTIGDEILYDGNYVKVVGRHFSIDERSGAVHDKVTIVWKDVRLG